MQFNDVEEETSKLASRVTAALAIYEEHMSDYHTRLKLKSNKAWAKNQSKDTRGNNLLFTGARWMHPCNVLEWKQIHWNEVWDDGTTRMEKRTRREAKWKTTDETRPKSEKSSCSIYRWSCSRWWRSQCHRFNALPFVMERQVPSLESVQQLWMSRFREAQYNHWVINDLVVMHWFFPTIPNNKKNLMESTRELGEEPDCMCSENCVVWTSTWA